MDRLDHALREWLAKQAQIGFEPPDHDRLKVIGADRHTADKPVRVQHLQQSGE